MSFLKSLFSKNSFVLLLWLGCLGVGATIVLFFWSISVNLWGLYGGLPSFKQLENPPSELASEVYSADGILLGKYFRENRSQASFNELSPNLVKALYATEDVRFEGHSGIDFRSTFRVIVQSILLGNRSSGGGSTLSQQLAKNLFRTRDSSYYGSLSHVKGLGKGIIKAKEWITAIKIERSYTKKEIITMYLNTVYFGSNAFGIKSASRTFFGKDPIDLKAEEAAVLVGVLKAPTAYSPIINPENALERRNTVLGQMKKYNFVTATQYDSLAALPIDLKYKVASHNYGVATYFRAMLQNYLFYWCRSRGLDLYGDGLRIYTTLDSRYQMHAEAALEKHMKYLQGKFFEHWEGKQPWTDSDFKPIPGYIERIAKTTAHYRHALKQHKGDETAALKALQEPQPMQIFSWHAPKHTIDTTMSVMDSIAYAKHILHAALMSVDPHTGQIKAWVGGINFRHFKFDHIKQQRRQPGSTFKPIVYTAAIDNGFSPCYQVLDEPITFYLGPKADNPDQEEIWQPKNAEGEYTGKKLTLREGLARSVNTVSAYLIQKLGPETVVEYAHRLGITNHLDAVPALSLGACDVSVYELTSVYATFVNKGIWIEPRFLVRIEDKHGNLIKRFTPKKREALSEETAHLMVHMLKGASQIKNGTALGLYRLGNTLAGNEVAAKTGTTSDHADGWFMGANKDLMTGIWVGGDDPSIKFRSMNYGQGSRMAMPIWSYYMDDLFNRKDIPVTKGYFPRFNGDLPYNLNCDAVNDSTKLNADDQGDPLYQVPDEQDFIDEL